MSVPAISIVVPVFNAAPFLGTLLASLLAQTETSLEVIAVDDGSSDDSVAILRRSAAGDLRLRIVQQANGGPSAARNLGIAHARGRWLAFADADDWLDPRTLRTWLSYGEEADLEVVLGNAFAFHHDPGEQPFERRALVDDGLPSEVCSGGDYIRHSVAGKQWRHFVWLQLLRRDFVAAHDLRFEEGIIHEDVLWTLRMGLAATRIGHVDEPLYGYRVHPASLSHDPAPAALEARARGYLVVLQHFVSAAAECDGDRPLRRAILRHAQREGRNFFALLHDDGAPALRRELALEFDRRGLWPAMYEGSANPRVFWRAARNQRRLRRYAR